MPLGERVCLLAAGCTPRLNALDGGVFYFLNLLFAVSASPARSIDAVRRWYSAQSSVFSVAVLRLLLVGEAESLAHNFCFLQQRWAARS